MHLQGRKARLAHAGTNIRIAMHYLTGLLASGIIEAGVIGKEHAPMFAWLIRPPP